MGHDLLAKPIIERLNLDLQKKCETLKQRGIIPTMKVLLVGNNPASASYVRNKKKFIEKLGALCDIVQLEETVTPDDFLKTLHFITEDKKVHGCFVQLPLPKQLSHINVGELIPAEKDVDGFTKTNLMHILEGDSGIKALAPCTPKGIVTLLKESGISLSGKNVVIIGRSLIVGKPLALLMLNENATVTICHSKTKNLIEVCRGADILVAAIGRANFVGPEHVRPGQVVVDVGINYDAENKLCGDVNYAAVAPIVEAITPVPGGVGPMTIFTLAQNLLQASQKAV